MAHGDAPALPRVQDVPRHLEVVADDGWGARRARLRRTLAVDADVRVVLDPADDGVVFRPVSGLSDMAVTGARTWVRLDVEGWEAEALECCRQAGLLDRAAVVELDAAVAGGFTRSPSVEAVGAVLGPSFTFAGLGEQHADPGSGLVLAARALYVRM